MKKLSGIGDRRVIPELNQLLEHPNMRIRFAAVKVLCALGEPLRAEWIVPVIKSERWTLDDDPETSVKDHGGANAASILIQCLDMTNPSATNVWNVRLVNFIRSIGNPELDLPYHHHDDLEGTPQQIRENAATLQKLQDWLKAHPPDTSDAASRFSDHRTAPQLRRLNASRSLGFISQSAIDGPSGLRLPAASRYPS